MLKRIKAGAHRFRQIVRRNVGCHADSNAGRAVDEKLRQASRQHNWLLFRIVEIRHEIDRIFIDVRQHLGGDLFETHFGVAHGRRTVAVDRAEVALSVNERIAHREVLRHSHNRLICSAVAMRVILAEHFTHNTSRFFGRIIVSVSDFLHRIEHVAHIGKRTSDDYAHGVVEIGATHFRLKRHRQKLLRNGVAGRRRAAVVLRQIFVLGVLLFVHRD